MNRSIKDEKSIWEGGGGGGGLPASLVYMFLK